MSIIVTAATGNLGSLIVDALLARGAAPDTVVATARDASKLAGFAAKGVQTADLDYSKPETVTALVKPGDVVILVSGTEFGKRVEQHSAVITAAKAAGAGRVIYTSAPKATTSPLLVNPEHKATEEFLTAAGIDYTILRNGWYTENYVGQIDTARATGEVVSSAGDGRVASASRSDYAEAAAVAALDDSTAGKVFELSGDYAWNFDELASAISDVIGQPVVYRSVTPDEEAAGLAAAGLDEGTIGFVTALAANTRDGLLAETSGELKALIGHPTVPLVDGLAATQE